MILKDADALKEIFKQRERWHFTGIIAAIDNAPTIDAKPVVRGHWTWEETIKLGTVYGFIIYLPLFRCSNCNHLYESYYRSDEPFEEDADFPNYCENCGAKMDEVQDGTD